MADLSQIAQRFKALYVRAMTDVENGKPKPQSKRDSDYAEVSHFINDLTRAKDISSLDICIRQYLAIYLRYSPADRRSKMAFFHLVNSRLDLTAPQDKYLAKISSELNATQGPFTAFHDRFQGLEADQKSQIVKLLKYKEALKNQYASILDELEEAYADSHAQKKGSISQLYSFNPLHDDALEKSFRAYTAKCVQAWDLCNKELSDPNWSQFLTNFKLFVDFLKQYEREKLKLFQILRWCREPYIAKPVKGTDSGRAVVGTMIAPTSPLEDEFYFQAVNAIFLRAIRVVNPVVYQHGFPPAELNFFLDPLSAHYYYSNYKNRLSLGVTRASEFHDGSTSLLWLLLFAKVKNVSLVRDEKLKEIAGLYSAVVQAAGTAPPPPKGETRTISTKGKSTWDYAKGFFKIGDKLGAGPSETEIVYFEGEDTRNPRIFLEYTHMRGPLFEVDINAFIGRVEATPRLMIWEANKGLMRIIAEYFGLLFTLFFPGVGYFGVFLEKGFVGVLRQVLEQEALEVVIDRLSEMKASSGGGGGPGAAMEWLSILASGKKIGSKLAKKAEREALQQAKADYRMVEGRSVPLLTTGEGEAPRLSEKELGNLGLEKPIADIDPKLARAQRMVDQERDDAVKKIEKREQEKLQKADDRSLGKKKRTGDKLTKNRGTSSPLVNPYLRDVLRQNPTTALEQEARSQFARDLELECMPPGTRVRVPRTPQTDAGLAQNIAMTPKGSPATFDVDIEIDFSNEFREEIGRGARKGGRSWKSGSFGVDGIKFPKPGGRPYLLRDHKEVQTRWKKSFYSAPKAAKELWKLMQDHLTIGRALKPYGYVGTEFVTNDKNMAKLLETMITELRKSISPEDWTGLFVVGPL